MLRSALIFFLALIGCSLSGCWQGVSRNVMATVLSGDGEVDSGAEGQNGFRAIRPGTKLRLGNVVRTPNDAKLNIALLPGALVQLSSNSEIKIQALQISKDGNETGDAMLNRNAHIRLNRGQIAVLLTRRGEAPSELQVTTQEAVIAADSDCLFGMEINGMKTRVISVRGKIYASPPNGPRQAVDAGFFQEWPSNSSTAVSAADEPLAEIETMKALEAEGQLIQSEPASRKGRPF